ncbi:MAG TPA: OsmC family protein [Thermoanaerobaculia bacterium]|nr:OsmC family protein [Thermoanaerobaculia bacterium]
MSVRITGRLLSHTTTFLTHESGSTMHTMAPKDNGGDGSTFSPTDLCAASYVSCAATTIGLYAQRSGIPLEAIDFSVEKQMTPEPPRRIARLVARFRIHSPCGEGDFAKLVNAGKTCPVRRSLHPDVAVEETYERA